MGEKVDLKSNMDRFIVGLSVLISFYFLHLKSNMDRFIGNRDGKFDFFQNYLKSNMDRFIDVNNNALRYYVTI